MEKIWITWAFGGVVVMSGLLCFQNYIFQYNPIMKLWETYFNKEIMDRFASDHKSSFNETPSKYGYPDMGSGRYSRELSYGDWYRFNVAQWVHNNNVEHLAYSISGMMLLGLFYPWFATFLGGVVFVGRWFYYYGYIIEGPNSQIRHLGAYPLNIAEMLMILSLAGIAIWKRNLGPFLKKWKFY